MHVSVPVALVVIGTLVVVLAAMYVARQLLVSRQRGSFECALWRRALTGREGWQLGLMRFGTERLRWYRAFSLRVSPEVTIRRGEIRDIVRTPVGQTVEGMEPQMLIEVETTGGDTARLLVSRSAASGLMAWIEAAPAGHLGRGGD